MQKFLRTFVMTALLFVPWITQAQNANVSEYDYTVDTASFASIATTGTAWTPADYVDVELPFGMYLGTQQIASGTAMRVYPDGSVTFAGLDGARIAPLYYASGYQAGQTSIYYRTTGTMAVVEWRKVVSGGNVYSFQLKLNNNSQVQFCYGPMTFSGSLSVFVGLQSSATDIFRCGGTDWSVITRYTTSGTRTLSASNHPYYNTTTGEGLVYTFTQPACVKPTSLTASASSWNTIALEWTVGASPNRTGFQVKYSDNATFDPETEGQSKNVTDASATTYSVNGLLGNTDYYFYLRSVCSGGNYSAWSPMASATTPDGCPAPTGAAVSSTGVVSWTASLNNTTYTVKYGVSDFDPATEGTAISGIATTSATVPTAGFPSATTVDVYVNASCSVTGTTTNWVYAGSFVTPCNAITVNAANPYTETFSDGSMPQCWSEEVITGSTHWQFSSGYASFSYTPGASARLMTPTFNLSTTGAYQVEFYHAEPDYNGDVDSLWLYYRTSATAEWVRLGQYGNHTSTLTHEIVLLPNPSATYQLAFVSSAYDCLGLGLDNVVVRTQPTCPVPSALAVSEVNGSNVTLAWTENGSATNWQIAYYNTDEEVINYVMANANPYTVSNLGLGLWRFYVRSICSVGDTSDWYGYAEQNFGYCVPDVQSTDGSGLTHVSFGESLVVNNTISDGSGYQNFSSMIGDGFRGSALEINLTYSTGSYPYGARVWVDWNQDLDFEDDGELVYTGSSAMSHTFSISIPGSVALGDYRMRIGGSDGSYPSTPCGTFSWSAIQDYTLRVIAAPTCFKPSGLAVSNLQATSATFTWTEAGASTQWELKLGPRGFNPDETGYSLMVSNTPTVTVDYLYMVTNYDAYVRAICNPEGPTAWSNVCEFKTPCENSNNVEIGVAGATNSYLPSNTCYKYSWTEQIYEASEIGGAMVIDNIAFEVTTSVAADRNVTIYLGETANTEFASTTSWIPASSLTQVYTGTMVTTSTGWHKIDFDTPFSYSGNGNLVVAIDDNTGSYKCTAYFRTSSSGGNKALRIYSDGTNYNPNTTTYTGTLLTVRNDIKIERPCDTGSCNAPTTAIALSETEYAATLTFTDVNEEANPTYGIIWGPRGFNPESEGTTVSPITANTYTISNLTQLTDYDVYVYAICSGTPGRKVRYGFTTPFIPNCKTPILNESGYGAANITYNTADLTWRQPGDAPLYWVLRYAATDFNPATAAASDYTEMTVTSAAAQLTGLVAGTTYYIYVKSVCAESPLDESPWSASSNANPAYTFTTPTCGEPIDVVASDVTNSTAVIGWTEAGNATAWTLKYGDKGFDPDLEGTAVEVTTNPYELTGLDAATAYDVYVKAVCTATDESDWSAAGTFVTACPGNLPGSEFTAAIGTGTSTTTGVPVANYGSTYCQQIFTAEELTAAGVTGNITSLTFNWQAIDASYDKYFSIYLANTTKSSFASTSDFVPYGDLTRVYGPVFIEHGTGAGEQEYEFSEAFQWDGVSNIVVVTLMNAGASDANASRRAYTHSTGSEYRSMYQRKDGSQYTEEQLATITGSSRSTNRANIIFKGAVCDPTITCFAPASVSTDITTSNVVTVTWAPRTDLRPIVNNYELKYGLAGFDPENAGILVSDLNDTTQYIINSELAAGVDYDVYVRTVCSETSHSNWTKSAFHTYPNCWVPDSVTITNPTQTSVTIAWRENTPTPATRWQIAYGEEGFDPDNTAKATYVETTNNLNYVLNGLHYMTTYDVYVRAICGENNYSDWSVVAKATTACGTLAMEDMPFVENFDGVTGTTTSTIAAHVLPNCWDYLNGGTSYAGYPIAYNSTTYRRSGNNSLRFWEGSADTYADQYAILPQFGFDVDTLDLSFYAREYNTTASYVGKIVVGVMTNPEDASTFVAVDSVMPTTTTYQYFEVKLSAYEGAGRYVALKAPKTTTGFNVVHIDDLTVKVREQLIPVTASQTVEACNAFVMADTAANHGTYANNLNATYVVKPAEAGKVAHLTGSYDMENGYDFISIYRGTATAANLIGTYTGTGNIDMVTSSYNWADSGFFTIVVTSDADNALKNTGFKFLVSCECPAVDTNIMVDQVETNGEYVWTAGNGLTYANHSTNAVAVDVTAEVDYTIMNTAQCDSAERHLSLVLHPDYSLTMSQTICERDSVVFFDTVLTTTGTYTRTGQSVTGADSTVALTLQVSTAPLAYIYYNNRNVTSVENFCDAADMAIEARSNVNSATYMWDDSSAAANRVVNPHESNTYTVVATNPNTGCTSLPATLTVTTVPVADLTISGDSVICAGQSATLTVADANNLEVTYRWSNNATGASITVNPTETTTYTVTGTANNCQTTAEFTVTVNQLPVVTLANSVNEFCLGGSLTVTATEVDGYTYSWNTGAETAEMTTVPAAAGNYTATLTVTETATGCSAEFTSEAVAVYPSYELNDAQSACAGMLPYTWGTMSLTEAGTYDQTFTIAHSCDSLVHLAFEVEDTAVNTTSRELCYGTEFTFGTGIYEQTYTATETGIISYVDTTTDVCAARYNLNLTVNMPATTTFEETVCDTKTWNGNEYTTSGEYTDTLATVKGCDSVITMTLTVNYSNTGVDVQDACDSYEWIDGIVYTESTSTPTFTLTNGDQCDSVVTLNLTINNATTGIDEVIYCDGTSFTWIDGETYNLSVSASDGITYTYAGANAAGCDSIVTLDLTMNYVLDTLAWADTTVLDELVIDTVACDNSIHPAYINQNGDYQLRTRNQATGEDQITRLHVTVNTSSYHTVFDTACAQYTWWLDLDNDGTAEYEVQTYTQSGVYSYDRGNGNIEMLQLTINQPAYETTDTVVICQNGVYTDGNGTDWNGADLELGLNEVVWNVLPGTGAACETRQVINLTVNEVYAIDNDTVYLCSSNFDYDEENDRYYYEFTVNAEDKDTIYVNKFDAVQTIDTTYDYTSATGCDSTVSFHFTVNPNTEQVVTVANCYEYIWDLNGERYTESGLDTVVNTNENGCPNTVILDLTINTTVENHIDSIVCMSFEWQGQTYTENQSFVLEDSLTAESGCDSVVYIDFIVKNHQLNNQVVVANVPYTWVNGVTYDSDTTNVFFDASPLAECDSVLMLTLTRLTDTLTICDNTLPYTTDFGYTVAAGMSTGIDDAIDEQGSGFYMYNIVNVTGSTVETAHGCQSYTWAVNGQTYTEAGDYAYSYAADANGCVRVDSLHLTISAYNELALNDTACGSYTWTGYTDETYTVSGAYTDTLPADPAELNSCETVVTLNLVIPAGQKYKVTECYEYTWLRADSTTQVFTASDSVGYTYTEPLKGCTVEDTLVLTINTYLVKDSLVVKNAASYIFNNILYIAYLDTTFSDTIANPTGCDSVINYHLIVSDGDVVSDSIFHCGNYQWRDGNVYGWISAQDAMQHGTIFRYKNLTTGAYVYENPEYYVFNETTGALDTTYVLWLTLAEAAVDSLNYGNVLASQMTTTPVTIGDTSFNFAEEFAAKHDTTVVKEVHYGSTYYCDSIEYYTFNLVYNYTVYDTAIVCGAESTYNWRDSNWAINGAGLTTTLVDTADLGTADEWVHIINVAQYDAVIVTDTAATACDSFTWNDSVYTASGMYQQTYTDQNGCDSVVTINLTVNHNSNGDGNQTITECYEYTWHRTDGTDSTYSVAGTHIYEYLTPENCPSVDTLVLTLNGHDPLKTVVDVCDSFVWEAGDQLTYYASNYVVYDGLDAIGCLIHDTLDVTIRNSNTAEKDTLVNGSYAMIDDVMYEGRSDMDMNYNVVRHLTNAVGCDSVLTLHLTITPYRDTVINEIACGTYTWTVTGEAWSGNDHTYQWISAAERAANNDALYKDVTADEYVYTYPSDTVDNVIYRLNLALNEAMLIYDTINFPLSLGTLNYGDSAFDFTAQREAMIAAGTTQPGAFYGNPVFKSVNMGSSSHYCDSIYFLTINLVNNYYKDSTTICYTDNFVYNGNDHSVNVGTQAITAETFNAGTMDEEVITMIVTVRPMNQKVTTGLTACDTYTWVEADTTFDNNDGVEHTYSHTFTDMYGCDSLHTIYLTINHNAGDPIDTVIACDKYNFHGTELTETGDTIITWADDNGCSATDSLNLTIVSATPTVTDTVVCDNFHWVVNNSDATLAFEENYPASAQAATQHYELIAGQQCYAYDSLYVTVHKSSHYDSILYISDGSYRYHMQSGVDTMLVADGTYNFTEHYDNAEMCDSTLNLTFNVGTAYFLTENIISCDTFVWAGRTGDTYKYIDAETSAAHNNALYLNQTTGDYVMYNPVFVKENAGDFDSIIMLRLTLTQIYTAPDDTTFNISNNVLVYGDSTFDFTTIAAAAENFHDTTVLREVHFGSGYYCDSVINLYIHLINNFTEVADTDICATATEVAWRGQTISTANTEYDIAHVYHIYDTLASGIVEYLTINQHPMAYLTERRTACDSYTWEETGDVFTESTTVTLTGGVDQYGCPATTNLVLTINHSSSVEISPVACDKYDWTLNNAAHTALATFTESVDTSYSYISDEGCPSVDVLHLTVNHNSSTVVRDTVCDSYMWIAANGDTVATYTASGAYDYNYSTAEGCPSTDSLYLTIKTSVTTAIDSTVCNSMVWNDVEYISSGHYTQTLTAANGCDSTVTLTLHVGRPSTTVIDSAVCDSLVWEGNTYTVNGTYTDTLAAFGGCDSIVTINLTVNSSTNRAESAVACRNYHWDVNDSVYTTSGHYVELGTNEFGCASNDTLHLTIGNNRTYSYENVENCGPYTWIVNGDTIDTYEESIETSATVVNPNNGCDSIIFLTLTVIEAPIIDSAYTVCESAMPFVWRDTTLTEAGTASVSFPLASGCDSTINMTLTVTPTINTVLNENVCLGLGYNDNNFNIAATELATAGTYTFVDSLISTVTGCDSIVTLNITVGDLLTTMTEVTACVNYAWTAGNNEVYNFTADTVFFTEPYINAQGCTSVDTLALTISQPVATTDAATACDSYNWNGTEYTVSGEYVDTLATVDGCDSIVTMTLTINNSVTATDNAIACSSYTWNNNEYTASGDYTDTLTAANGCDSIVTLTLVINMPVANAISETACGVYVWNDTAYDQSGTYEQTFVAENGCDSVVTLTLTINSASTSEETVTACDSYTWNDSVYTESGIYTYTADNAAGCDSVATLNLTINVSTTSVDSVNACNYYEWNGTAYTTSGTYTYSATNAANCDSVATLVLTINTPVATAISETACESYTWNNATYSTSGDYQQTFVAENGCDSVVTLSLTINNAVNASETATACNSYTWNGETYTTSGTYTYTTTAANSCDSIVTLTLTINEPATETVTVTNCGSYTWNGQTYNASGIYTYNTTAANGCDSIVTLALTVNQPVTSTVTETACDSYTWNGVNYTTSGNYTYTGTAANGCDSVVTLALTINNTVTGAETATACDSYTWNGQTYTTSGTYTWNGTATTGCDSIVTLTLTVNSTATATETAVACDSYVWNGIAYAASGSYTYNTTAANGCDSVVTLDLTINQSVDTTVIETAETNLVWNGVTYTQSGTYTWNGTAANGCDSTVTLVLTITNSIYDTNYYTVAVDIQNPGMGEVTGTGVYADGSVVTLTATPNDGFAFVAWMMGNDTVTTTLQHTFTVVSDTTFTAVFVALPVYYTVAGVANDATMGYVEQGPTQYAAGTTAHLTAQANDGYHFVRWSNGETTPDIYFTVTCDITLTAYFEANEPVTGVEDVDMNNVTIYSTDTRIFVRGAEGFDVYVYDVNGRVMNSQANAGEVVEFRMPATGVYLVKVGNAPAKRVLVVR